jgi:hypothetical protein
MLRMGRKATGEEKNARIEEVLTDVNTCSSIISIKKFLDLTVI